MATNGMAGRRGDTNTKRVSRCSACELELVTIRMLVDGSDLVMESCQRCDLRRWHLAGSEIDLQEALAQVGEHAGRRR
jgi:hypothetical protein